MLLTSQGKGQDQGRDLRGRTLQKLCSSGHARINH